MNARKEDTRRKIELGGLVIKAGIGHETKAVVLGALVSAARVLNTDEANARARFQAIGEEAFGGKVDGIQKH